jgi:hypothetical protein
MEVRIRNREAIVYYVHETTALIQEAIQRFQESSAELDPSSRERVKALREQAVALREVAERFSATAATLGPDRATGCHGEGGGLSEQGEPSPSLLSLRVRQLLQQMR